MHQKIVSILVLAVFGGIIPRAASTQTQARTERSVAASRISERDGGSIRVDGVLDEAAWSNAAEATDFIQREPNEGTPATENTRVRIVYDDATLYIGIEAFDSDPAGIVSRLLQRDKLMQGDFQGVPEFAGDDAVAIILDPFHDHRNGVIFATNANGAKFEALLTDEAREFNVDWRGIWDVRAQKTETGWSAEFAIPFRTLRYPASDAPQTWGFNVYRVTRRTNEESLWTGWSRQNEGFHRVSRAGHLEGLAELPRPSSNIEVKPFVLGGLTGTTEAGVTTTDGIFDAGVDIKYEVRPGLLLDLTYNTDFAQVEVDDQQVNLTRFNLFFPEKRDFFLENAGIFEFGSREFFGPPPFLMFFSRKIGLSDEGEVPVIGGARLTGRVGGQTVGFMNVVTNEFVPSDPTEPITPLTNFSVARVKRDIGESNFIGAMVTDRRASGERNTVGGMDFSFWPTQRLNLQGFATAATTLGDPETDAAYRLAVDYRSDFLNFTANHMFIGPDFDAGIGFITRDDIRRTDFTVRLVPRPQLLGIRRLNVFFGGDFLTRSDGLLQDWNGMFGISPVWDSGDDIAIYSRNGFTRLDESFTLNDDQVLIPAGDYDVHEIGWFLTSSRSRPVVLESSGGYEWNYNGKLIRTSADITVTPNKHLALTVGASYNSVSVPGGSFNANLGRIRLTYAATTNLVANALVQYNSLDRDISTNIRVNFIHRPGSDLFFVFTEQRGDTISLSTLRNRGAVAKITYLARL
ncbi:MAG: carbohydrate binding family 9 domain-containing protein [Gemmatimonadota bacterium]|nr:carbohydrate binding family 9 domain-containing protein [Gemmatimonadota bacterium]